MTEHVNGHGWGISNILDDGIGPGWSYPVGPGPSSGQGPVTTTSPAGTATPSTTASSSVWLMANR
ncbi:hypothetical protein GCM10010412_043150 [Nonomuraea recticatena]|uniref:Uncharacterized protein n=1 Tax=Nonomuraea recticatena TaxID=46178 RepID=A0ABN3S2F5_9ACTN